MSTGPATARSLLPEGHVRRRGTLETYRCPRPRAPGPAPPRT